ncbi:PASTA domain-containing protein [Mycobacterium hodleri]|uniref:PASTA domain-containing protein n=1 Tax=Mycolicibacterium hodleri TaxID=49897 RepID=UPI0021F3417C|nr:PASTA domain-containing protein [Mycolicibacterium hodleri]MCV7131871.1 PASTA domain-containing protein [Mycolicibacterium hodleri]
MHAVLMRVAGVTFLALMTYSMSVGPASAAPSVTGQSYADASSALSSAGLTATVATTVGDQLPRDKCLVVNQHNESVAQKGSHSTAGKTVALSLNCYNQEASATKPGFSAGSPEGRAAKAAAAASKKTS